jgi:hypothetical protein
MKKMYQKIVTCLLAFCMVLTVILPDTSAGAAAKSTTTTVSTQKALDAALKNDSVTDIVFETQKEVTITIAASSGAKNKKLTISAANATVTNSAVFKSIKIKNASKYTEKATGNSITVTDSDAQLVIAKKASVKSISSKAKKLKLTAKENATVKKLTNKKKGAKLTVSAAKGASVKVTLEENATVKKSGKGTVTVKKSSGSSYSAHGLSTKVGSANIKYHGGKTYLADMTVKIPSATDYSSALTFSKTTQGYGAYKTSYYNQGSGYDMTAFRDSYIKALEKLGFEMAYEYDKWGSSGGVCYFRYNGTKSVDSPLQGEDGNYYPLAVDYGTVLFSIKCAPQIGVAEDFAEAATGVSSYHSTSNNIIYMGIYQDSQDYQVVGIYNYNENTSTDSLTMMVPANVSAGDTLTKSKTANFLLYDHGGDRSSYVNDFKLEVLAYTDSVFAFYVSYNVVWKQYTYEYVRYETEAVVAIDISSSKTTSADDLNNSSDSGSGGSGVTPGTTTGSTCAVCKGKGTTTCNTCHGHIKINCTSCNGSGTIRMYGQTSSCAACGGVGWTKCKKCTNGSVRCTACGGTGRI